MTPEIIPQIPLAELERPYSKDFTINWDKVYLIKLKDQTISLNRIPNRSHHHRSLIRIGAKAKINIVREKLINKPNYQPRSRSIDDPDRISHLNIQFWPLTDKVAYIDNHKLEIIHSSISLALFRFESDQPISIETVADNFHPESK